MNIWNRYVKYYIDKYSSDTLTREDGLPYLRNRLFISILLVTLPIGFLGFLAGFTVSIKTEQYIIAFFDSVTLLGVIYIFFARHLSIQTKKLIFSMVFYTLSVILLAYLGLKGPAPMILFSLSILITLYQNRKAGLLSVVLNGLILMGVLSVLPLKSASPTFFLEYNKATWIAVGLNLVVFNALIVLAVDSLVVHLYESFLNEKDLQKRLKAEGLQLIAAKEKAEESDRLKSAFLANMSHEIRTPMNGIMGFSALLSEPGLESAEKHEYIEIIQKSSARMLNILNEIMDISKIEAGLMVVNFNETNINQQVESIFSLLKPEAENKKLKFSFSISLPDNQAVIKTDKDKLFAILTNLIKNAIKYTDEGSIEFGYVLTGPADQAEGLNPVKKAQTEIEFFVRDTGIGIPLSRQEAIFERFIQADIDDIQARQGSGLGLSIAKAYVEMLYGRIWVDSMPGQGSTFYFTLPYLVAHEKKPKAITNEPNSRNEKPIKKLSILIVEDDLTSEMLISIIVNKMSSKLLHAHSGNDAVKACLDNPDIDLILMDIRMPDMDGHEATRQIRQFNSKVIIIAQTAYGMLGDWEKSIEAGCNDWISKPVNKDMLLSLIYKYFAND